MQDSRRFIRYVVPGLTLIIEFFAYLLISGNICFSQLIQQVSPIGVVLSVFLASGGLGFLLGVIYYTFVWLEENPRWIETWPWRKIPERFKKYLICLWKKAACLAKKLEIKLGANYRPVIEYAQNRGWLKLFSTTGGVPVEAAHLSKRNAWCVAVSYWDTRAETSDTIKGAILRVDKLGNLMNGLGTTCVASLAAFLSFVGYQMKHPFDWYSAISLISGIIILLLHYCNYKGVIEDYEKVAHAILRNEFERESMPGFPIKLYVSQNN